MMAHQESITGAGLRTPRAAAVAGIVFALLLGLTLVLLIISSPSDSATKGAWLTDRSKRATVALALNLVPFAGIAFLWFVGVAFAGGLIANAAAHSAVPGPDTLAISRQITRLFLHVYALRMAAVFTI